MKSKLLSVFKGLMAALMVMPAPDAWARQVMESPFVLDRPQLSALLK